MKLVMKADDGKEIVYLSANDYDVVVISEMPEGLIVDVSRIPKKYTDCLENIIRENIIKANANMDMNINIEFKRKRKEFSLVTPDIYFVFDEELYNIVSKELEIRDKFLLAVGCRIEIDGEDKWAAFFTTEIKKDEN